MRKLVFSIGTILTGWALKKVMEKGYKSAFKEDPPNHPESNVDIVSRKGILWTIASGVTVSLVKAFLKSKIDKKA